MHGTPFSPEPTDIRFDDHSMWVTLVDGRTIGVPLAWYPKLRDGSPEARGNFFLSPSGIHWDELDEDIAVTSLLADRMEWPSPARAS